MGKNILHHSFKVKHFILENVEEDILAILSLTLTHLRQVIDVQTKIGETEILVLSAVVFCNDVDISKTYLSDRQSRPSIANVHPKTTFLNK